ncbi:hypothetical protein HK104_006035 [Borealophlyctis nickersoniae]|nr:hypothetical protein HK104_006035 [Borealophlyctis nickersoniae]
MVQKCARCKQPGHARSNSSLCPFYKGGPRLSKSAGASRTRSSADKKCPRCFQRGHSRSTSYLCPFNGYGAVEESDDENSAQPENGVAGGGAGSAEGSLKRKAGVENSVSDTDEGGESAHPAKRTVTRHFPDRYTKALTKYTDNWRERYKAEILSRCRECMQTDLRSYRESRLKLCDPCETLSKPEYNLISATEAKKRYLLNDRFDLERWELRSRCLEVPFRRNTMMRLYVKKDLERVALKKYGGEEGFARAKAKAAAARKEREARWERKDREYDLREAVKAKGLPFRWIGSALSYVHGAGKITLDSVVSDIAELHVLQDHTRYLEYLDLSSAAQRRFLDIETAARERSLVLLAEVEKSYKALSREQRFLWTWSCSCGRPQLKDRIDAKWLEKLMAEQS